MDTTSPITYLEFCFGLGGIHRGLKRVLPDLRVVAYAEIEAFAVANLVSKIEAGILDPAPICSDLKEFPSHKFRGKVDGFVAGFNCQPFSTAGKRLGNRDPRHLWPHLERAVGIIRPGFVFFENVEGIITSKCRGEFWASDGTPVLLYVCQRLEVLGYRVAVDMVSASEVGAPHQRKRIFIGAIRRDLLADGHGPRQPRQEEREVGQRPVDSGEAVADLPVAGLQERLRAAIHDYLKQQAALGSRSVWPSGPGEPQFWWEPPRVVDRLAVAKSLRRREGRAESKGQQGRPDATERGAAVPYSDSPERSLLGHDGGMGRQQEQAAPVGCIPNAEVGLGDRRLDGPGRGGEQPEGSESRRADGSQCPIESAVDGSPDGLPDRLEYAELCESMDSRIDELRAIGNAVVPECAERGFVLTMSTLLGINP